MSRLQSSLLVVALLLPAASASARPESGLPFVNWLISAWDVTAAEAALANIEAEGELGPLGQIIKARLRFFQGAYEEASALLAAVGDPDKLSDETRSRFIRMLGYSPGALWNEVAAAAKETESTVEVATEDGNWLIRYRPGPDAVLIPILRDVLPLMRQRLGEAFALFPDHPVLIEMYPEPASLARATGLKPEEIEASGTIAITKFNRIMVTTPNATVRGYDWVHTMAHEYVHLLVNKKSRNSVPIWLHEAIAKYFETAWDPAHKPRLSPRSETLLAVALRDDQLITFEEMSPSMAKLPSVDPLGLAFAEVFTTMQFLLETVGAEGLQQVLQLLADGKVANEKKAVAKVTGMKFKRFVKRWKKWMKTQGYRERKDAGVPEIRFKKSEIPDERADLSGLDKEIADFVLLGNLLRGRERHEAGLREYEKALAKSGGGQLPTLRTEMASAHLALDDPAAALIALDKVHEVHRHHTLAHTLRGQSQVLLKQWAEARTSLQQALKLNPFDPSVHNGLVQACTELGDAACRERAETSLKVLAGEVTEWPG